MDLPPLLQTVVNRHRYPLLFASISGAHLYGFPSPDSDYDLRGVHVLPVESVIGLKQFDETLEFSGVDVGIDLDLDLVTHDIKKFLSLMLKANGYVLEQLYSPLILKTSSEHKELKTIGKGCITRHHSHHYLGFAAGQWKLFLKDTPHKVKPLLYIYRVLLTGIYLMRTGIIEANLVTLNETFKLSQIPELIACKTNSTERSTLTDVDFEFHRGEYDRLSRELEKAASESSLPESPSAYADLDDFLRRIRLSAGR